MATHILKAFSEPPRTPARSRLALEPSDVATAVEMLLAHKNLSIQDANVVGAALRHFRNKPAVSFSDCLVLEVARKAGHLPLGTFDRDFAKLPDAQRL